MESIIIKFTKSTTLLEVDVYIQKVLKLIHPDTEIEINTDLTLSHFIVEIKKKTKPYIWLVE
jgi:hypothetical protein|tara:strand:+ start:354 stop:539 length:186 start_codon:yes stop_codon:yes gene_type:complete